MIRVYRYDLRPPVTGRDAVLRQMKLAREYQRALWSLEMDRRRKVRCILSDIQSDLLRDWSEALRVELAESKGDRRKVLAEQLREVRAEYKSAKQSLAKDSQKRAELASVEDWSRQAVRDARAQFSQQGLYWGSYLLVEQSHDQVRASRIDPREPRPFRNEGLVGVQLQGGLSIEVLRSGRGTLLAIDADLLPAAEVRSPNGKPKMLPRIRVRIGSDCGNPIWASWPWYYREQEGGRRLQSRMRGRPLPKEGTIKWARVVLRQQGPRECWSLHLTIDTPTLCAVVTSSTSTVAMDLGWRITERGLRVGYMADTDGGTEEIMLPRRITDDFARSEKVRSDRDLATGQLRPSVERWVEEHPDLVPEAWKADVETIRQWKSVGRVARLIRTLLSTPGAITGDVQKHWADWKHDDRINWQLETALRVRGMNARKDFFCCLAKRMGSVYGSLILERMDLRPLRRNTEQMPVSAVLRNASIASVGDLRVRLLSAFGADRVLFVAPEWTTIDCFHCGSRLPWDPAKAIDHKCEECGHIWDQDQNAARNMLDAMRSGEGSLVISGISPGRGARLLAAKRGRSQATAQGAME